MPPGNHKSATCRPDLRAYFIAGMLSVSLVMTAIKSTDPLAEIVAMSRPILMTTPFCWNFGMKSESIGGFEGWCPS